MIHIVLEYKYEDDPSFILPVVPHKAVAEVSE